MAPKRRAATSGRSTPISSAKPSSVPAIRLHDLRHSLASLELAAGTHPRIVADRLGHSQITMTLDRYSHVDPALQERAADALSERLYDDEERATTSAQ